MGPIRAFVRPPHGAAPGESVTTASLFSPTHHQSFSGRHRQFSGHAPSPSLALHHHHHHHHHHPCAAHANPSSLGAHGPLFNPHACASLEPPPVGLGSSLGSSKTPPPPSARPYSPHRQVKKPLPPGALAATAETPQLSLHRSFSLLRSEGVSEGRVASCGDNLEAKHQRKQQQQRQQQDEKGKGRKSGFANEENDKECKWKISDAWRKEEQSESNWKRDNAESKVKKENDKYKWNKGFGEVKWKKENNSKWKKDKDEYKWKGEKTVSAPSDPPDVRADVASPSQMALVFPFSDEEDEGDEDVGVEGRRADSRRHEAWAISDIVETEDEEGDVTTLENVVFGDPRTGKEIEGDRVAGRCVASPEKNILVSPVVNADHAHVRVPEQAASVSGIANVRAKQLCKSLSLLREKEEEEGERGEEEEDEGCLEMRDSQGESESDGEDLDTASEERKDEEGDAPRDGVRATQRLRPRSYRQFLLTRERRSREFLKARSYHLGRWFVTHFTHPYPSKEQKDNLASRTNMTRNQVSEWFGNMRRRIREATRGHGVCWEEKVRIYNSVITGKSEPLPIEVGDAINTWVPPIPQEPSVMDTSEEISVTPKFKTTLLHRYLSNSFESPGRSMDEGKMLVPATSFNSPNGEETRPPQEPYSSAPVVSEASTEFSRVVPLCTSSPKDNIQARWNTSFENVKDSTSGVLRKVPQIKVESRMKFGRTNSLLTDGKTQPLKRSYSDQLTEENFGPFGFKKQRSTEPAVEWLQQASTSKEPASVVVCRRRSEAWANAQTSTNNSYQLPSWNGHALYGDSRSSDDDGGDEQSIRPEELAAAYTLVQLQNM